MIIPTAGGVFQKLVIAPPPTLYEFPVAINCMLLPGGNVSNALNRAKLLPVIVAIVEFEAKLKKEKSGVGII